MSGIPSIDLQLAWGFIGFSVTYIVGVAAVSVREWLMIRRSIKAIDSAKQPQ